MNLSENQVKILGEWDGQPIWRKKTTGELLAEAVARTRLENGGVSIEDIAKVFKTQFEKEELVTLINQLSK